MTNLTPKMIEKAKVAKSAEELLALAKENNVEMTADEAATYFAQLNPKSGELSDDDLDNVAGGACAGYEATKEKYSKTILVTSGQTCDKCGTNKGKWYCGGYSYDYVACEKCNYIIARDDGTLTYELIDE